MHFDLHRIGAQLSFSAVLPQLEAHLARPGAVVVQAPPGTGKTTLVPPAVANAVLGEAEVRNVGVAGKIVVTQPRRVAARAAARRLAYLTGGQIGELVGYTVRGERTCGTETIIEFCTPGVLLNRLLSAPDLPGTSAVVIDEVHERGLETDLLVGMLAEVRTLREDLRLVTMSATLDAPRFAALLGDPGHPAPIVTCDAATHPLQVRWQPASAPRLGPRGIERSFLDHVAVVAVAAREQAEGDALVFVPGALEVDHVVARIRQHAPAVEVLPLHGRLSAREQDVATSASSSRRPRIVVSTSLAESSLTVPGVRLVVDAGLSREPRRDSGRAMGGLVTRACSRDSAIQRAGRAARLGPGTVVRCYDEATFAAMAPHSTPQIAAADLTGAALALACWGTPAGAGLPLPDPPPTNAIEEAVQTLHGLGAVDELGQATPYGRELARAPVDPRLARALFDGTQLWGAELAAQVVAMVSSDLRAPDANLVRLLRELRAGRGAAAQTWAAETRRLTQLARRAPKARTVASDQASGANIPLPASDSQDYLVGALLGLAFPTRIARLVGETYLLASGTRAALPGSSSLTGHEWLAIAEVTVAPGRAGAGTGALIRAAAPLSEELAICVAAPLLSDEVRTQVQQRVTARRVKALGAIEITSAPVTPSPPQARQALAAAISTDPSMLAWSQSGTELRRRLAMLHHYLGQPWPDVSDDALAARLEQWLAPELDALAGGSFGGRPDRLELSDPLRRLLPWPAATRLEELAPQRLKVPSGSSVRITYPQDPRDRPVVAVKLQECFGWADTPRILDGAVPLLFHLLSPAQRPLAVTDDLASFWSGPYAQVRSEMRGRYPKHPWPVDPWSATPTARARRRP
ncbi:ATP-dependent helicase HrpB [Gephyromycinifex aptenodytis]|uniref:ATP-dependent helicase HrpB n=1 Tax=Gephyromycinifex aptenodytis TaxID=2716227 RepID=UPI001447D699|nr:ATP-dependent helicase HrpB [Gephyromycinifex aptenodytis]